MRCPESSEPTEPLTGRKLPSEEATHAAKSVRRIHRSSPVDAYHRYGLEHLRTTVEVEAVALKDALGGARQDEIGLPGVVVGARRGRRRKRRLLRPALPPGLSAKKRAPDYSCSRG